MDETLCEYQGNEFQSDCLERSCRHCGTKRFQLLQEESTRTDSSGTVKWQKFVYVEVGEKRKLKLVEMQTCPGEMFFYFIKLLERFPAHRFCTKWQHEQLQNLLNNLPFGHVCCIHDYSENITIGFSRVIMGRPKLPIITEHLYVISPDLRHDHHSVKGCQNNVAIVYAATARFICLDLERIQTTQGKELFSLPEHQHLDILEALNGF